MKFYSKYKKLQLWLSPAQNSFSATGERFYNPGRMIQFDNGAADVFDEKEIDQIRKSELFANGEVTCLDFPVKEVIVPKATEAVVTNPDGEFVCLECGKTFKKRLGLSGHMMSHKKK